MRDNELKPVQIRWRCCWWMVYLIWEVVLNLGLKEYAAFCSACCILPTYLHFAKMGEAFWQLGEFITHGYGISWWPQFSSGRQPEQREWGWEALSAACLASDDIRVTKKPIGKSIFFPAFILPACWREKGQLPDIESPRAVAKIAKNMIKMEKMIKGKKGYKWVMLSDNLKLAKNMHKEPKDLWGGGSPTET